MVQANANILFMNEVGKNYEHPMASDYPLPIVSDEIADSLLADVEEQGLNSVLSRADECLHVNNPDLFKGLGQYAVGMLGPNASPEAVNAVYNIMIMTHELLRRQGEADALQRMISQPEV